MNKILVVYIVFLALVIPVSAANTVSIGDHVLTTGETKRVPVLLNDATDIWGINVTLSFNSSVVNVTTKLADAANFSLYAPLKIDNNTIKITAAGQIGPAPEYKLFGLNGTQTVGYVNLTAVGCGVSTIDLEVETLITAAGVDINSNATAIDGSVNISDCGPPPITQYTISVSTSPPGLTPQPTGGGTYFSGNPITVTAQPVAGYTFKNWTENGVQVNTSASYSFTVTGNRTLIAQYSQNQGNESPVLQSIVVSPSPTITLTAGQTQNFISTALDQNNNPMAGVNISWTVSNTSVGTITTINSITDAAGNSSSTFNALSPGTTMVNATNGSVKGTATVIVNPATPPFLQSIEVTPESKTMLVGENFTFVATPKDQYNATFPVTVTWSSSNTTVGSINATTGNFTALANGTTTVTATNGSVSGNASVTVTVCGPRGDLNCNGMPADAGDLVLMKRASVGEITPDSRYDLNGDGMPADAGDLVLMKRASIGEIIL